MRIITDYRLTNAGTFDAFFMRMHRALTEAVAAGEIESPQMEWLEWDFPVDPVEESETV
jgi:hypothetical protein